MASESRPVVLLEFNELCPSLMDRFINDGKLPTFRRFREQCEVFRTDAEEHAPHLEPWIQWVTVHTGLPYSEHGIVNLSEGHKLKRPRVWDLVSQAGRPVWVCGSMNVHYEAPLRGWILPDPWSDDVAPHPGDLAPYDRFVRFNVREYTNVDAALAPGDYAAFLGFMLRHGLSGRTLTSIARQLLSERFGNTHWKRAFILDDLQFDLFSAGYRRLRPAFSTFFLNSTAHMQHVYWRHMEPDLFKATPTNGQLNDYRSAILHGYQRMDRLLDRMLDVVDGATVVFATALSQQPCLAYEERGGKHAYRPRRFEDLLRFAGVENTKSVSPVMSEQFWVTLHTAADASVAAERLSALHVDGKPAIEVRRDGTALFVACAINDPLGADAVVRTPAGKACAFFDLFYPLELKSGMHHPEGMLWIRRGEHVARVHDARVPLTSVAPTLLGLLGISPPDHMRGRSVLNGG